MKDFIAALLPLCRVPGDHTEIWEAIYVAQRASAAANPSISKMLVNLVGQHSASFIHSLTACLMSVGEKHGPIGQARDDLWAYDTQKKAKEAIQRGYRIAGFGNSFFKDGPDPQWAKVSEVLAKNYPTFSTSLLRTQQGIHMAGKKLFPNPAGYTAAAANATGLLRDFEEALFVMPRMQVWFEEYVISRTGVPAASKTLISEGA